MTNMAAASPAWLTPDEAAHLLGVPRGAILRLAGKGGLKTVRLPTPHGKARRYRIAVGDLMAAFPGEFLTIDEAAAAMKVSRRYVYYLISQGHLESVQLPSRRTGKPWGQRISRKGIARFVARLEEESRASA